MGYIHIILTGLAVFPFLAVLFTIPYTLYQYHHYGSVSRYRTLLVYSFILYMLIAYFMVILPLPTRESTLGNRVLEHLQPFPLMNIVMYFDRAGWSFASLAMWPRTFDFWQLLFNVIMVVPFGIYLRYYFEQSFKRTVLYSFLLSLFYETTQITGLYGIYHGPYRAADMDDLICNTLGGIIGFILAFIPMKMLLSRADIDRRSLERGLTVSGRRRFWALFTDFLVYLFLYLGGVVVGNTLNLRKMLAFLNTPGMFVTLFIGICWLSSILTGGSTVGKGMCRMRLAKENGKRASIFGITIRYLVIFAQIGLPRLVYHVMAHFLPDLILTDLVGILAFAAPMIYLLVYLFVVFFGRGKRKMLHTRLSRTTYISTIVANSK